MTSAAPSVTKKKSITKLPVQDKTVLVRVDFNVPIKDGVVSNDARLRAALKTINYLRDQKAKIILMSHLGRPKGQVNSKYSLKPIVGPLGKLLNTTIHFADDCVGEPAQNAAKALKPGEILLLENLRFHAEEEKNDPAFGKQLASLADYFVQEAFGSVHRAHASTAQVPSQLESAAGFLLENELSFLEKVKSQPERPYAVVLGGAKVSDKIGIVKAFLTKVDTLFIGGAMAYTFLKAQGHSIGDSLFEKDHLEFAKNALSEAAAKNVTILLPKDHRIVQDLDKPETSKLTEGIDIPDGWKGVDIGPKTLESLAPKLTEAKTVFWNGPAGIFETDAFSKGTMEIAKILAGTAKSGGTVVVGGGDSVAAAAKAGVTNDMTFISTGGGASLEFLEGKTLPGVAALPSDN